MIDPPTPFAPVEEMVEFIERCERNRVMMRDRSMRDMVAEVKANLIERRKRNW